MDGRTGHVTNIIRSRYQFHIYYFNLPLNLRRLEAMLVHVHKVGLVN